MEFTSKAQLIEALKKQIANSDKQALKALVKVYNNQTKNEQIAKRTDELNGVGFTGSDAEILTSFAEQYQKRGSLSTKQMALTKKIMPKYANQLINQSISSGLIKKDGKKYVW